MRPLLTLALASLPQPSLPCQSAAATAPPRFAHLDFAPAPDTSLSTPPPAGFWRTARNAGANALFVTLHGHGVDVAYEDVVAAVDVTAHGANLRTLAAAAAHLGMALQPAMASPQTLGTFALPLLLHMDPQARHVQEGGRIAVLVSIDEGERTATLIDGVTAIPSSVALDDLFQVWSGAVLAPRRPPARAPWQTWGILLGFAVCGFGLGGIGAARGRAP